ncbi:MAG: ClpXP protease specificity-enhancing factor [Rubrivivax sp.]
MTAEAAPPGSSTRPYLLRALHDWCTDNGFTPYIAVHVDASVQVPPAYVKNDEIVLNIGFEATSGLKIGNEFVEFRARFGGVARDIVVPVDHVVAIYARENGQGMAFPMPAGPDEAAHDAPPAAGAPRGLRLAGVAAEVPAPAAGDEGQPEPPPDPSAPGGGRPALKRIK